MFGPAGHVYVYFTYGMHWCANVVCGDEGEAAAVLLRAGAPVDGIDRMEAARGGRGGRDLASGPAKLCQALGIDRALDGTDLVAGDRRRSRSSTTGRPPPRRPARSTRVGISEGREHPWRYWVPGDPNVSRGRPELIDAGEPPTHQPHQAVVGVELGQLRGVDPPDRPGLVVAGRRRRAGPGGCEHHEPEVEVAVDGIAGRRHLVDVEVDGGPQHLEARRAPSPRTPRGARRAPGRRRRRRGRRAGAIGRACGGGARRNARWPGPPRGRSR